MAARIRWDAYGIRREPSSELDTQLVNLSETLERLNLAIEHFIELQMALAEQAAARERR